MIGFTVHTANAQSTQRVGRALAEQLSPGDCVALHGDLGAGKTCFVRGMAMGLGCEANLVSSPTFTLMHRYAGNICDLVHVDAYRLRHADELRDAGIDTSDTTAICAVEWPMRVPGVVPIKHLQVHIEAIGENDRMIVIANDGSTLTTRVAAALAPKPCPSCEVPCEIFGAHWPFCSSRCRDIDLGRWLDGRYQISRPLEERDLDEG